MIAMAAAMRMQAGVEQASAGYAFDVKPRWPLEQLVGWLPDGPAGG
jgi:N6-L-threonylcarbamoyladenine synthase